MANAGIGVEALPSVAEITIFEYVPAAAVVGVPERVPDVLSKIAQVGLPEIVKVSESPSASEAEGRKL
jgi:hypothetical protein